MQITTKKKLKKKNKELYFFWIILDNTEIKITLQHNAAISIMLATVFKNLIKFRYKLGFNSLAI